ncbi:MAG: TIGR02452 family protein [Bacteroidota bacterium]
MKKSKRVLIAKDTLSILDQGYYINSKGQNIPIKQAQKNAIAQTLLYRPEELVKMIREEVQERTDQTTAFLVNGHTTLDSVRKEYKIDPNLVCLNFASARNPGGGFLNGSQAQEESIARATGLYPCLLKAEPYYVANRKITTCIYTDHMIYAPKVPVIKVEDGTLMEAANFVSIITAPAVNTGVVLRNEPQNIDKIPSRMRQRIDMVLAICKKHQHQTLILGAWGCGVFRNDPQQIAQMFYESLMGKYRNQFKKVVFSVYSKNERFIKAFQEVFDRE